MTLRKYGLWRSDSEGADTFFEADSERARRRLESDAVLICVIEAHSWEEAQQKRYDLMDWGDYVPMETG